MRKSNSVHSIGKRSVQIYISVLLQKVLNKESLKVYEEIKFCALNWKKSVQINISVLLHSLKGAQ